MIERRSLLVTTDLTVSRLVSSLSTLSHVHFLYARNLYLNIIYLINGIGKSDMCISDVCLWTESVLEY